MPDMQLAGEPRPAAVELHRRHQAHAGEVDAGPRSGPRTPDSTPTMHRGGILSGPIDGPDRTAAQYPHPRPHPGCACSTARRGSPARWSRSTATRSSCAATPGSRGATATCRARSRSTARRPTSSRSRGAADDGPRVSPRCAYRVGQPCRGRRQGTGRPGQPHLGGGSPRRRAGREGVGRRPARRGHRRRTARRRRPPRGRGAGVRSRPRPAARCAARPPGGRQQGGPPGGGGAPPPRARDRDALRRRVAGGAPEAVGIEAWPAVPKGQDWKTGVCAALGVAEPARCGGASSARCRIGRSSSSRSSPRSSSSSTSSPLPATPDLRRLRPAPRRSPVADRDARKTPARRA